MKILYLLPCLWLAGCSTPKRPTVVVKPKSVPPDADVAEAVRFPEVVRAYHVGRYADPNHSSLLHEQHRVYRIEAGSRWNFRPAAYNSLPLVALAPPRDAAFAPLSVNDALVAELSRQKDITETVAAKATLLTAAFDQLQAVLQENRTSVRAQAFLGSHIGEMEKRLEDLETELRKLIESGHNEKPEPRSPENTLLGR